MKNWVKKNMFHVCSFALALSYICWSDFVSLLFFGEPDHPLDN